MDLPSARTKVARFGLFEADLEQRTLTKAGLRVRLQDQPFQVLALLLGRPGEIVTREEIRQKLWQATTFVEFDDGLNTAIKKLRTALGDSANNPRFVETVPRRGYRFLAPVAFAAPVERVSAQTQAAEEIAGATCESSRASVHRERPRTKLPWVLVLLVLVLGGAVTLVYKVRYLPKPESRPSSLGPNAAVKPRPSIAVLGFRNVSGSARDAWLSVAISEMLSTELSAGGTYRTVTEEDVARSKVELSLLDADSLGRDSLARLRTNLGSDLVVLGSYTVIREARGKRIRVDLRLQDTQTGDTIAEQAVTGRDSDLFELISSAGLRLRQNLSLGEISSQQAVEVRASLPASGEAARYYAEGLSKLRMFDGIAARELFFKTIAFDQKFARAHSALAQAWSILGYDQRAKDESRIAFELSSTLSRPDRMWIEGTYREANFEWDKAIEIYKTLYDFFPDNLDYGLRLADVQRASGNPDAALAILQSLHKLPPPSGRDPRIDLSAVQTWIHSGDLKKAQGAVEASVEEAKKRGARLLLAQALYLESLTLVNIGDMDKAISLAEQAREIYHDTGDRFGEATALEKIGTGLWFKSEFNKAVEVYRQALAMNEDVGNQMGAAHALNYIGSGLASQSDLEGARRAFERSLTVYKSINAEHDIASTLTLMAWVESSEGDLQEAKLTYDEAIGVFRKIHDRQGIGSTQEEMGLVIASQGDLEQAERIEQDALRIAQDAGDKVVQSLANSALGNIAVFRGDADRARRWFDAARALETQTGDAEGQAEIAYWLAWLDVMEGRLPRAEASARGLISQFRSFNEIPNEIQSTALLIKILVTEGKYAEAQREIDLIHPVASKAQCFEELLQLRTAHDQVEAGLGKAAEAKLDLKTIEVLALKKGFVLDSLEAKLALGEVNLKIHDAALGKAQLIQLERNARSRNFGQIARRTAAAREESMHAH